MTRADIVLQHIDWKLLREQKEYICSQSNPFLDGILHLMDSLQDAAFIDCVSTEAEIFGEEFE